MQLYKYTALAACFIFSSFGGQALAKTVSVASPNGQVVVNVDDDASNPSYTVIFNNEEVISRSALGMAFKNAHALGEGFTIAASKKSSSDSTWEQPWGERKLVRDNHTELQVDFSHASHNPSRFTVRFRVFDDGVGFRYEVPKQKGLKGLIEITNEYTEFNIQNSSNVTAWWIPARGWNRYEYVYNTSALNEIDRVHTPFTFKLASGTHVSIHEAALVDYAGMALDQRREGMLKADLAPWSDGVLVKKEGAFNSPWRTIQIASNAVGLLNSDLILNLNEPNKLGDVSWVEPAKYVGIWWGMHINENTWGSGPKHGATTANTKYFMDFAAKYGFAGVLVEGWNIGWDGDWYANGDVFSFTKPYDDFDIAELAAYGKEKGVRIIGHHETSGSVTNYKNQMADAFDLYQKHNVAQVKTGYVADGGRIKRVDENGIVRYEWHDGQFMSREYLRSVTEAAKRKISINTHEPIKDTGLRRTYPNWIAREGARGQEFNAWGSPPNPPEHTTILPFTRMLSGPMDFTPGIFDLSFNGLEGENRPRTTLAKQLALYVVIYSPIQMAADLPRNYEANLKPFQFILDVTTDWQESIALAGEVGEFVTIARKAKDSDDWFLGTLTDENKRNVHVDLSFLDAGKKYEAQIYRDGNDANWQTKPYDIIIENKVVTSSDSLTLPLATSGGAAIRFKLLSASGE